VVRRKGERVRIEVVCSPPSRSLFNLARIGMAAGMVMPLGLGPNLGVWNGVHVSTT